MVEPFHPDNRLAMPPEFREQKKQEKAEETIEKEKTDTSVPSIPRFILADTIAKSGSKESVVATDVEKNVPTAMVQLEEVESSFDGNLPFTIREILGKLKENSQNTFFEFCKSAEPQLLMGTSSLIEQARQAQNADSKDKMFTIPGINLTVVLMAGKGDMLRAWDRRNNVAAIMYAQGKLSWNVLYLGYSHTGTLYHAEEKIIKQEDFSQSDWKYVVNLGERILEKKRIR